MLLRRFSQSTANQYWTILRKKLVVSIALLCCTALSAVAEEPKLDVFELLAAEWADNQDFTCYTNPHTITFSEDRSTATFSYKQPPDRSHWASNMHEYSLSPESSSERTIVFKVLDHGKNWLALQPEVDAAGGGRATAKRWRITLTNEDAGYKWRLYGAPPGHNSILRGVRCDPEDKIIQDESEIYAIENLEDVLSKLTGTWEAPGRIMGRPVTYRAEGSAVLQGSFVQIYLRDLTIPARYEAIILIGKSKHDDQYIVHWLDVFGPDSTTTVGIGELYGDKLIFKFEHPDHTVVNTFHLLRSLPLRADRFNLVTQYIDKETEEVSETASYEFKKVDAEQ